MIIANGVPKSGTTLLMTYLRRCGCIMEPGGLIADERETTMTLERNGWGAGMTLDAIMAHGNDRVISAHLHDAIALPEHHRVAFIVRHPRNVLISWARMVSANDPSAKLTASWMRFNIDRMNRFVGWFSRADAVIRYESFVDGVSALTQALKLPCATAEPVMNENAPWITPTYRGTWTGKPSDWREYWDESLQSMWSDAGGLEVETAYGYAS